MSLALKLSSWGSVTHSLLCRMIPPPSPENVPWELGSTTVWHLGAKWTFSQGVSLWHRDGSTCEKCGHPRRASTVQEHLLVPCKAGDGYDGAWSGGEEELTLRSSAIGSF